MGFIARKSPSQERPLGFRTAFGLAAIYGLIAGNLDLVFLWIRKRWVNPEGYFRTARDFVWTVPAGHVFWLAACALGLVLCVRVMGRRVSVGLGSEILAGVASWWVLLRLPVDWPACLVLGLGVGVTAGRAIALVWGRGRLAWWVVAAVAAPIVVLTAVSWIKDEARARARAAGIETEPPPAGATNVLLIVWDTVRAANVSHYGYERDTTPNLRRLAAGGATFGRAIAPAPWTYPSHTSFLTGRWPYELNSQWHYVLDGSHVTLAEHMSERGYQTAAFVANTSFCSYETGLDRGFDVFEDYPFNIETFLGRTAHGNWFLSEVFHRGNHAARKWTALQARDARGINEAFLGWLTRRRRADRPFFRVFELL